jgi:mono/diheme cytochrome c family protein
MKHAVIFLFVVSALWSGGPTLDAGAVPAQTAEPSGQAPPGGNAAQQALIKRYCVGCHNERLRTAGLALDGLSLDAVGSKADVWEKVVAKLNANAMPPVGRPRPSDTARREFVSWLESELDRAAAAHPNPGRTNNFHRLNRTEYQNAIRDLLALDLDASTWLPGDDAAYGFDNNADVLSISPTLFDGYLSAAAKIARLAVGDMSLTADHAAYNFGALLLQRGRISDDLPLGAEGGVTARHYFPLDAEYVAAVRLTGTPAPSQRVELRLDGVRVGEIKRSRPATPGATEEDGDGATIRFAATAGSHVLSVVFVNGRQAPEGQFPEYFPWGNSAGIVGARTYLNVKNIELTGPFAPTGPGDTPSRRQIFTCRPANPREEVDCASKILSRLARLAYRRPVTSADVKVLLDFYRETRSDGGTFDTSIRAALERLLVDPDFLYRIESEPSGVAAGSSYRIPDLELASRLSFFLWSSIPDDALLQAAERGGLKDPKELERQVRRMLADRRASSLVTNFAAQWLYQRNLRIAAPDFYHFPDWDDNLRLAMARETELFLESQLRTDRPVDELLTANYTFLNDRLARHYGVPGVHGSHFRRVTLTDERRFGLLGHASLLTVTSMPNRTSPVVRGKWLLENMLGYPAPAPPPDVPALSENDRGQKPRSVRERLEEHRKNPACASCHAVMDPIGFSLDEFDAIGRTRTTDGGVPVDATGALPDGRTIAGVNGLRALIVGEREQFVRTVTEKLLTYAVGRGVEYYDMPTVRGIVREASANDYSWSSIILSVVKSQPFQMRTRKG